jgi:cytochrome c-type biogenesis protein CcmE
MATDIQYTPAPSPEQSQGSTGIASVLSGRRKLIVLGSIGLLAFLYFAWTAFQAATAFYLGVDELVERGPVAGETFVQVKGKLKPYTFARESPRSTLAHFELEENGASVPATYNGILPDLFFNPHSEIVLGGHYGADGVFAVEKNSILIKCPSKYQALEEQTPLAPVPGAQTT